MAADRLDGKLKLGPDCRHEIVRVGAEREPVLVVDDFLAEPQALIDAAAAGAFAPERGNFYPGLRARLSPIYSFAVRAFLGGAIEDAFGFAGRVVKGEHAAFSVVTTPPERLALMQRLPHVDTTDPLQLAVLHYLSVPAQGGTCFYRHRATGFETLSQERLPLYTQALQSELDAATPAPRYLDGDTDLFARTAQFEGAFNRVLVYRSAALHCADVAPNISFSADPRIGRLTANLFLCYG
jgi:Family of unknown function (DUF6445)